MTELPYVAEIFFYEVPNMVDMIKMLTQLHLIYCLTNLTSVKGILH